MIKRSILFVGGNILFTKSGMPDQDPSEDAQEQKQVATRLLSRLPQVFMTGVPVQQKQPKRSIRLEIPRSIKALA